MTLDQSSIPVLLVIFFATLIRSAFGFGEALVAVPLLALLIPVELAAPVAALVSITVAAVVVAQDWHKIHLGSARRLVVFTVLGIPFGLVLLTTVAESIVKAILAVIIIGFSSQRLLSRSEFDLSRPCRWCLPPSSSAAASIAASAVTRSCAMFTSA
jgi:uncharacterized membrane protein YfcA